MSLPERKDLYKPSVCFFYLFLVTCFFLLSSRAGWAQPLEENAPPVSGAEKKRERSAPSIRLPETTEPDFRSPEPIGVDLRGIRLLSDQADVLAFGAPGIDTGGIKTDPVGLARSLEEFIGSPLSGLLISEIRNAITSHYMSNNRPLLAVTVPPQELTAGILQIVITPFRVGDIRFLGNQWTPDAHLLERIGIGLGDEVDSAALASRLDWLNQNPYRNVAVLFEPGQKTGETILTLRSQELRPWRAYTGYQNTGVSSTNRNRFLLGFNAANIPSTDHLLSYQLTTSPDFWWTRGQPFRDPGNADYASHSLNYFIPLSWQHKLTVQASYIKTNADLQGPFEQAGESWLAYLEYAVPIRVQGDLLYDFYGALEWKRQKTRLFFGNVNASRTSLDVAHMIGGVRGVLADSFGSTGFDVRVVFSPGEVLAYNDDEDFIRATGNPDIASRYVYVYGSAQRTTPAPFFGEGVRFNTRLRFQATNDRLPGLEQITSGGVNTIRGYPSLSSFGNWGFTLSNELRMPSIAPLEKFFRGTTTVMRDRMTPFVFVDSSYVEERSAGFSDRQDWLVGTGVGMDYTVNDSISFNLAASVPLSKTPRTRVGRVRLHVGLLFFW